ncbi:MAG: CHAT domain-containing protein [Rhodobacteraceae bacterium]|nr:CHAT domain-containing protein [Paracoccaceae bacterium]MCP5342202.1 CHAT domain-containing protein [Paracoccaceae bacterium]
MLMPTVLAAQDIRNPRLDEALTLADEGRGADAIALAEEILAQAESEQDRWYARETLAAIAHLQGRDAEALDLLREVVASGEALFGPDNPLLVYPLQMLAATEGNLGDDTAVTRTMLRTLRLTRAAALSDPAGNSGDLLYSLSDLARHYLDTGENLAAALLAAEMVILSEFGDGAENPAAIEGNLLRALAHLRMGRPVEAASFALPVWQSAVALPPDAVGIASILDEEFADLAGDGNDAAATLARWAEAAARVTTERDARDAVFLDASAPMMAALNRGDAVAADLAARPIFDRTSADDPLVVNSYLALMIGTYSAGRNDLAATWAARLADMPAPYLAGFVEDPAGMFRKIAERLLAEGRPRDAARLTEAAIDLASLRGMPQDVDVQNTLTLLGAAQRDMGDLAEAETALTRAVELGDQPGPEPARARATVQALGDLAALYLDSGRKREAIATFDRAMTALQTGPAGHESSGWLFLLADFLPVLVEDDQGPRALTLARQAVEVAKTETADALAGAYTILARTHLLLDEPAAAAAAAGKALSLAENAGDVAPEQIAQARVLAATARLEAGDATAATAIMASAASGQTDPVLLVGIAIERAQAGDTGNARQLLAAAIDTLPPDSPVLPYLVATDGAMLLLEDDPGAALEKFRAATWALTQPDRRNEPRARDHLALHVDTALRLSQTVSGVASLNYATEAFQVAQRVNDISAGAALGRAAARLRATTADAALRVRKMDDAERALGSARDALVARLAGGGDAAEERVALVSARVAVGQARDALSAAFPDYGAFADPKPLDLLSATRLLRPDEVLVVFATSDMAGIADTEPSVVMALTAEGYIWSALPARAELADLALGLRCAAALSDRNCGAGSGKTRGAFSLVEESGGDAGPAGFDYEIAHRAYAELLEPVAAAFEGKTALTIVPDKALAMMPFHLMLTSAAAPDTSPREAPWLIRRMAVSVAPSVSSLSALRDRAVSASTAPLPFLGVGDPLIGSQRVAPVAVDCGRYTEPALLTAALETPDEPLLRNGKVAREGAIAALPALPETRCELAATAGFFGPASQVMLQEQATETAIKAMSVSGNLERFRILSFATHGLVAGELGGNQAGLVLSPPDVASAEDDGLLTIEEIAGLRLNADFVLLSACNTAAGSRPADDSLSGLASAFFLAGARSLLVSHWPVYSDAAVRLTTGMFGALAADPSISRAEALRRSMLAILDDPAADAAMLHPAYWGPFIIAGDGLSG